MNCGQNRGFTEDLSRREELGLVKVLRGKSLEPWDRSPQAKHGLVSHYDRPLLINRITTSILQVDDLVTRQSHQHLLL